MKKNTTFHNLFQKIVSVEELAVIEKAIGYKDTDRKLDVLTLIEYFLCVVMNELKSYRNCAGVGNQLGLPKVNPKKASHMDYNVMKKLFHLVVSKCNRVIRRFLKIRLSLKATTFSHSLKLFEQAGSPVTQDITRQLWTKKSRSEQRHRVVFF